MDPLSQRHIRLGSLFLIGRHNQTKKLQQSHIFRGNFFRSLVEILKEGVKLLDLEVGQHDGDVLVPGVAAEDGAQQGAEGGEQKPMTEDGAIVTGQDDVTIIPRLKIREENIYGVI